MERDIYKNSTALFYAHTKSLRNNCTIYTRLRIKRSIIICLGNSLRKLNGFPFVIIDVDFKRVVMKCYQVKTKNLSI